MTRTFFSTLGLVALGAAIVVGMLAAFGAFGGKTPAGSRVAPLEALPEQTRQIEETASIADIGETVTVGDVSWTVTDATQEGELRKYTFPPTTEPGDYVSLSFTVENVSEEPVTLNGEVITLVDNEGHEYRPEPDRNDAFVPVEKNLLFGEAGLLEPGETKEGMVNFEVLPESSGFVAHIGGTDPTVGQGRYVDLGF